MQLKYVAVLLTQISLLCENQGFTSANPLLGPGHRDAGEREFSFVVSIGFVHDFARDRNLAHICTGTLVTRMHVLTAAHCFTNLTARVLQVTVGSVDLRNGLPFYSSEWLTYDQWVARNRRCATVDSVAGLDGMNDVAVMKLLREVTDPTIVPAHSWFANNRRLYAQHGIMAGWGETDDGGVPNILQVANVAIMSNDMCAWVDNTCSIAPLAADKYPCRYLCSTGQQAVHMSFGDSGGPLIVQNNIVVAVNTLVCPEEKDFKPCFGEEARNIYRFNVHTGISSYKDFITYCLEHL